MKPHQKILGTLALAFSAGACSGNSPDLVHESYLLKCIEEGTRVPYYHGYTSAEAGIEYKPDPRNGDLFMRFKDARRGVTRVARVRDCKFKEVSPR